MRNAYIHWIVGLMGLCLGACSSGPVTIDKESDSLPEIIPDYKEVTIPVNIAPLNFGLSEKTEPIKQAIARFTSSDYTFQVEMKKGTFPIPESDWKTLVEKSAGGAFEVQVIAREKDEWVGYRPFTIYVSPDSIDAYLAYRRIEPGYELWKELGIYRQKWCGCILSMKDALTQQKEDKARKAAQKAERAARLAKEEEELRLKKEAMAAHPNKRARKALARQAAQSAANSKGTLP